MSHPKGLCQWIGVVSRQLPSLSWSQAKVLGEYSYGMVMTRRSGLSVVADFVAHLCHRHPGKERRKQGNGSAALAGMVLRRAR